MSLPFRFRLNREVCKTPDPPGGIPDTCKELFSTPEQKDPKRSNFRPNVDEFRQRLHRLKQVQTVGTIASLKAKQKATPCVPKRASKSQQIQTLSQKERIQLLRFNAMHYDCSNTVTNLSSNETLPELRRVLQMENRKGKFVIDNDSNDNQYQSGHKLFTPTTSSARDRMFFMNLSRNIGDKEKFNRKHDIVNCSVQQINSCPPDVCKES